MNPLEKQSKLLTTEPSQESEFQEGTMAKEEETIRIGKEKKVLWGLAFEPH